MDTIVGASTCVACRQPNPHCGCPTMQGMAAMSLSERVQVTKVRVTDEEFEELFNLPPVVRPYADRTVGQAPGLHS